MIGKLARSSVLTAGVLGLRLATQAATLVLLTRLLQPAIYGHYASVAALAVVMGLLPSLGSGYVLLSKASGDLAAAANVWRYAWPLTVGIGALLWPIYIGLAFWLSEGEFGWQVLCLIGAAELLATPFTTLLSFALQASERVPLSQLLQWLPLGLRVFAALPCFLLPLTQRLPTYATLQLVASLIGLSISWWVVRRHVPLDWHPRRATSAELKDGGTYAAMLLVAANPTELDKIVAVRQVGATEAGLYTAGSRVMGALVMPVLAMLLSAQPRLFRHARTADGDMARLVGMLFVAALGWGLVSGVLLAMASPLLPWLFGRSYEQTAQLMPWMAITAPLLSTRLAAGSVLVASGHPLERIAFEVFGIACLIVGMLVLTKSFGVFGLIAAVIVAEIAMALLGTGMVVRQLRRRRRDGQSRLG
jgi:O-antigen/teichoic acid export membrane protein